MLPFLARILRRAEMTDDSGFERGVRAIVEGIGNQARDWIDWWRKNRGEQQPMKILDEMLRHPKYRFRETDRLAKAINDNTDGRVVTETLLRKMGARHNILKRDTWTMDKYWEKTPEGIWRLRKRVKPGTI
jgi:hypothetical protein